MTALTAAQKLALDHARHLAEHCVPVFLAPPDGRAKLGFRLPKHWQRTEADPTVLDDWEPGMAVCAVMGHEVDLLDVDLHKGGDASLQELRAAGTVPRSYGRQRTPSGGTHDLIAPLGVRSRDGVLPGIDVKAGDSDGEGRGFAFLAPTVKPSKVTGELATYEWLIPPDLTGLVLIGGDDSGAKLAARVGARTVRDDRETPVYDGPTYDDLTDAQRGWADQEVDRIVGWWTERLAVAVDWPEGETDDHGRGWEGLATSCAWALARLAVTPWSRLDEDSAHDLYDEVLPHELAADEKCRGKWRDAMLAKARALPVEDPPWPDFGPVDAEDPTTDRGSVDVSNTADAFDWLRAEVGTRALAGLFRRGREIVHTPRVGEHGYIEPADDANDDGPAQVRRVSSTELAARVDTGYDVFKVSGQGRKVARASFPIDSANRAASVVDQLPNLRAIRGVTHTPVIRADGSILETPGYDGETGLLYLPDPGLDMPTVPEAPTRAEVAAAGALLLEMVAEFPFVTEHDRANYLAAMLTPLVRPVTPPPYKLMAIGAPQRGSGKSLLAALLRAVHGGVFKSEFPTSPDELRKVITATLDTTSAPVVQFDNVRGVLCSSVLDGLLTSAVWSDRLLGVSQNVELGNDRLWTITGNNLKIGGDLGRRTLWVTINAKVPEPEKRTDFRITDLEAWVQAHRGELLAALLTLVRAWVVAGRPVGELPTSDSFGPWVQAVRGILANAELGASVGVVGHADSVQEDSDPEEAEWALFLEAAARVFGENPWTVSDLLKQTSSFSDIPELVRDEWIDADELPGDLADRLVPMQPPPTGVTKSLGKWLSFREGRWAGGLSVVSAGSDRRRLKLWKVVSS